MSRFVVERVDSSGIARREVVEAADRRAALEGLGERRREVRSLEPEPEPEDPRRAPDVGAIARAARALEGLVSLGVSLAPALRSVGVAHARGQLGPALERAAQRAAEGASLADALRDAGGPLADPVFVELLVSGQRSNDLARALGEVASLASRQELVRRRFAGAVAYPTFLLLLGVGLGALVATIGAEPARGLREVALVDGREVPRAIEWLASLDGHAPAVWATAALLVGLVLVLRRFAVRALATAVGEPAESRLPGIGRLRARLGRRARAALALRALASLVARSVPLPEAWRAVAATLALAPTASAGAQEGRGLAATLLEAGVVTPGEQAALAAIETAGLEAVADLLSSFASSREAAFERAAERLAVALEPTLELVVAVGIVVVGVGLIPLSGLR